MLDPMRLPNFFHRREVWLPTIPGCLVILLVCASACLFAIRHIHSLLAPNQPAGARVLIIEAWMDSDQLDQAIATIRNSNYSHIITAGSTVAANLCLQHPVTYAELARDYLVGHGVPAGIVTAVPVPESAQDRTYLSAVMVRVWLEQSGHKVDALDVFSSGVHSRRSRALYRMAFGSQVRIGILAARPSTYDPDAWWKSSNGVKTVIAEAISWIWTELLFWPAAQGSHEEKWGYAPR